MKELMLIAVSKLIDIFLKIGDVLNRWERNLKTKNMTKRLAKKYEKLFYVPCEREIAGKTKFGFYRLYGQNGTNPPLLLWESLVNNGEVYYWDDYGAEFRADPPYPRLDNA